MIGADATGKPNFLSDQRSGQVQLVMLFVNQGMERSSWHATKHLKIFHWNGFLPDHDDETKETTAMSQILKNRRYPWCE